MKTIKRKTIAICLATTLASYAIAPATVSATQHFSLDNQRLVRYEVMENTSSGMYVKGKSLSNEVAEIFVQKEKKTMSHLIIQYQTSRPKVYTEAICVIKPKKEEKSNTFWSDFFLKKTYETMCTVSVRGENGEEKTGTKHFLTQKSTDIKRVIEAVEEKTNF